MNDARFIKRKFMPRIFLGLQFPLLAACVLGCTRAASDDIDLTEFSIEKLMEMRISNLNGDNTRSTPPATNSPTPPKDIRSSAPLLRWGSNPGSRELSLTIPVRLAMLKAAQSEDE